MKAVVVTSTYISIDGFRYESLSFEAYAEGNEVAIRHIADKDLIILHKTKYTEVTYNGAVELSASAFVITFNAAIEYAKLSTLLIVKDTLDDIKENSDYPNVPFSFNITPNVETQIVPYAYPGYVTIKALSTNTANVYIGPGGVGGAKENLKQESPWHLSWRTSVCFML